MENDLLKFLNQRIEALEAKVQKLEQILKEQTDYICDNRL